MKRDFYTLEFSLPGQTWQTFSEEGGNYYENESEARRVYNVRKKTLMFCLEPSRLRLVYHLILEEDSL